jgi:hypothetical protein
MASMSIAVHTRSAAAAINVSEGSSLHKYAPLFCYMAATRTRLPLLPFLAVNAGLLLIHLMAQRLQPFLVGKPPVGLLALIKIPGTRWGHSLLSARCRSVQPSQPQRHSTAARARAHTEGGGRGKGQGADRLLGVGVPHLVRFSSSLTIRSSVAASLACLSRSLLPKISSSALAIDSLSETLRMK